jgi:hypothetical protein
MRAFEEQLKLQMQAQMQAQLGFLAWSFQICIDVSHFF